MLATTVISLATAAAVALGPAIPAPAAAGAASEPSVSPASGGAVTNLDHLDFLLASVPLPAGVAGHTTYRISEQPAAQAPWVYANAESDGSYQRVGGGAQDPVTGYYGQGAFDADDIARAAVVYIEDWEQNNSASSEQHAYQLLRELTYLQTSSGPNAGDVVLWQQADGTLNPTPTPADSPNPSDSGESFWLARTLWALGDGVPAFRASDPAFSEFLQQRYELALGALNRGSLARYGQWDMVNGARVPAWIVAQSSTATAEAMLGLTAMLRADPADSATRTALSDEATGLAALAAGSPATWPFGGVLATSTSRSEWNAWGGEAPEALSDAAVVLGRNDLQRVAERAVMNFIPQVIVSGGPDGAWTPTPFDTSQIAYGTDSLVESVLAVAENTHNASLRQLAGVAAGWFFGANRTDTPLYNRANGDCIDGVAADGTINRNCGAESTIHTELTMLALDANPDVRAIATGATKVVSQHGLTVAEAESGTTTGPAALMTPAAAWTGSANWSGSYVHARSGATVTIPIVLGGAAKIHPVVSVAAGPSGATAWTAKLPSGRSISLGTTQNGNAGPQGIAPTSSALLPLTLPETVPADAVSITAHVTGTADIDALLIQPVVGSLVVGGPSALTLHAYAAGGYSISKG